MPQLPPRRLPRPALLASQPATGRSGAAIEVTLGVATETDTALPLRVITVHDTAVATDSVTVEKAPRDAATADDYGLLLVPVGSSGLVFAVLVEYTDPTHASIWAVAVFVMTIIAMRDEHFSKLAKRAAEWLQPPDR